jgi:hypothetical protein
LERQRLQFKHNQYSCYKTKTIVFREMW